MKMGVKRSRDELTLYVYLYPWELRLRKKGVDKGQLVFPHLSFSKGQIILAYDLSRFTFDFEDGEGLRLWHEKNKYRLLLPFSKGKNKV